jgi:hypothetical protein
MIMFYNCVSLMMRRDVNVGRNEEMMLSFEIFFFLNTLA